MSTTMMPFLYQTRTLSTNCAWLRQPTNQFNIGLALTRRHFADAKSPPHRNTNSYKAPSSGGGLVRRVGIVHGVEPPSTGKWAYDSDLNSFTTDKPSCVREKPLIQKTIHKDESPYIGSWANDPDLNTFTIENTGSAQDKPLIRKHMYNMDAHKRPETGLDDGGHIRFDGGMVDERELPSQDEIYQLTDTRGKRESTITPSERHAFQKIFEDIFRRHDSSSNTNNPAYSYKDLTTKSSKPDIVRRGGPQGPNLGDIFASAINSLSLSVTQKLEAIQRYPPALRPAAARAIGLDLNGDSGNSTKLAEKEKDALTIEAEKLEALREPERVRVESMMKAAKNDFELWDIMEKEVFTLIVKMGLEELPIVEDNPPPPPSKKRGRQPKKVLIKKEPQHVSAIKTQDGGDGGTPLSIYGPLYPSYLLLGLRLFDRAFASPSPLALSLLPKIKSMGFISHVLGASTQFYNELIRIYRYRYDDFVGITDLLAEMEHAAVDMDHETLQAIIDITYMQTSVERGEKGMTLQGLWRQPQFAPRQLHSWINKIKDAITTRKLGAAGQSQVYYGQ